MSAWVGGAVASFGTPGGVLLAVVQSSVAIATLYYLLEKFVDNKTFKYPAIAMVIIETALTIGGFMIKHGYSNIYDSYNFWYLLAALAGIIPWIVAAYESVRKSAYHA